MSALLAGSQQTGEPVSVPFTNTSFRNNLPSGYDSKMSRSTVENTPAASATSEEVIVSLTPTDSEETASDVPTPISGRSILPTSMRSTSPALFRYNPDRTQAGPLLHQYRRPLNLGKFHPSTCLINCGTVTC